MRSSCKGRRGVGERASDRGRTYHLHAYHEDGVGRELAAAQVKEVLEAGAEQVDHHDVVFVFGAEPVHVGDAFLAAQVLVEARLVAQLRVLCAYGFLGGSGAGAYEFYGDVFFGHRVEAWLVSARTVRTLSLIHI